MLAVGAGGDDVGGCTAAAGADRARCWMVESCRTIAEQGRRERCLTAASALTQPERPKAQEAPIASRPLDARATLPIAETDASAIRDTAAGRIQERFVGVATAVHPLVYDRQLITVDDVWLFQGDRAFESGFEVGDAVQISRVSSTRFELIGPRRRPVIATRLRCEDPEANNDVRRKCRVLDAR